MNKELVAEAIAFAKEQGLSSVEVEGVKFTIPREENVLRGTELNEADVTKFLSPSIDITDEEILFYSTPYYDELQARKRIKEEQIKMKEDLNG